MPRRPPWFANSASALLDRGVTSSTIAEVAEGRFLIEATVPRPRLVVFGDAALAGDLVQLAGWLGWEAAQHTDADRARDALGGLTARDAIVVLDHALTRTGTLLAAALSGPVGYVGALGSRRTQERRVAHLQELGVTADALARLHGPTGLDLGATNRAETAMSICAEIAASRTGRSAAALRSSGERIRP